MLPSTLRAALLVTSVLLVASIGRSLGAAEQAINLDAGADADDAVRLGLLAGTSVPRTIQAIRARLLDEFGGVLRTHIVANGGHDHPTSRGVMFMCFESYEGPIPGGGRVNPGELFIGFFLGPSAPTTLSIAPGFVELIAWDRTKRQFNFWELLESDWNYRGNTSDIFENTATINLGDPAARFDLRRKSTDGTPILRCSGCHTLGAPIMKELAPPHNDWWRTDRKFSFGAFSLDPAVAQLFERAADASNLAAEVARGADRVIAEHKPNGQTLRQRLRSLFATMEMNLVSDGTPFAARVKAGNAVEIPSAFFVDTRLIGDATTVAADVRGYERALEQTDSRFPEKSSASSRETHHAFLVPARSHIDNRTIDALVAEGAIDAELVADVLAVDMSTPVYSPDRLSLIRFVPDKASGANDLRTRMIEALRKAPAGDLAAQALLANLTDPARTAEAHRRAAVSYLAACRKAASTPATLVGWLGHAQGQRHAMDNAQTAAHPNAGSIAEHGFREVFPRQLKTSDAAVRLNPASCVAEPRK